MGFLARVLLAPLKVISAEKSFGAPLVGSQRLNQWGLHTARMRASDVFLASRRALRPSLPKAWRQSFAEEGVVCLPDFLPADVFEQLARETRTWVATQNAALETPPVRSRGFGPKLPFHQTANSIRGFDRYDGDTLNRFFAIDPQKLPLASSFTRHADLKRLCCGASGSLARPKKFMLYELRHGANRSNPDPQKDLHRDTFHAAVKVWFFLEDVNEDHGPLEYAPGSHQLTRARLDWERARSISASAPHTQRRGGAFRASAQDLKAMGYAPPRSFPVRANTLVLADVRGFHRRGQAEPGTRRLHIYASLRPSPFSPFPL